MTKSMRLVIYGRVQGVFFRATLKRLADQNQVTGWVRNTEDGNVEAILQGTEENVGFISSWCISGPEGAQVEKVESFEIPGFKELYRNFVILP